MADKFNPTIPEGTNIFQEIGAGNLSETAPETTSPQSGQGGEIDPIIQAIKQGTVQSLRQARDLIDGMVQQKTTDARAQATGQGGLPKANLPGTERPPAPVPPPPAPAPAGNIPGAPPTPKPSTPPIAGAQDFNAPKPPAAPGAAPDAGASTPNMLADLTNMIKAASKIGQPTAPQGAPSAQATPNKPVTASANTAIPGRPTL